MGTTKNVRQTKAANKGLKYCFKALIELKMSVKFNDYIDTLKSISFEIVYSVILYFDKEITTKEMT